MRHDSTDLVSEMEAEASRYDGCFTHSETYDLASDELQKIIDGDEESSTENLEKLADNLQRLSRIDHLSNKAGSLIVHLITGYYENAPKNLAGFYEQAEQIAEVLMNPRDLDVDSARKLYLVLQYTGLASMHANSMIRRPSSRGLPFKSGLGGGSLSPRDEVAEKQLRYDMAPQRAEWEEAQETYQKLIKTGGG